MWICTTRPMRTQQGETQANVPHICCDSGTKPGALQLVASVSRSMLTIVDTMQLFAGWKHGVTIHRTHLDRTLPGDEEICLQAELLQHVNWIHIRRTVCIRVPNVPTWVATTARCASSRRIHRFGCRSLCVASLGMENASCRRGMLRASQCCRWFVITAARPLPQACDNKGSYAPQCQQHYTQGQGDC